MFNFVSYHVIKKNGIIMDVVILCGGKGTRLSEETSLCPKPMVEIGGKPILWHIMSMYSYYGFNRFILALGYKSQYIKEYFFNYKKTISDFSLTLDPISKPEYFNFPKEKNWEIVCIDTGLETLKGARVKRIENYLKSDSFHLTYGDGVGDIPIDLLLDFHKAHGSLATITAVHPPSRFGEMNIVNDTVTNFQEKPQMDKGYINGGFFIFEKNIFSYLSSDKNCDFEFGPLQKLAVEKKLKAFKHNGFWQCMDNVRERDYLNDLIKNKNAPWVKW
mgnify:CR=1 FL=1